MFCKNCGTEIGQNVETCPKCGKSQFQENKPMNKKKLIIAIIAVILVIAIVAGTVIIISSKKDGGEEEATTSSVKTEEVAAKQDFEITEAEYKYYYFAAYNNFIDSINSMQYYTTDYDTSKPPHKQRTMTEDEDGNMITWTEYFRQKALETAKAQHVLYNEAVKAGQANLSEREKKKIDETVEAWKKAAETHGTELEEYLKISYGDYMTESLLIEVINRETVVQNYANSEYEELKSSYTQEEIDGVYNRDRASYDMVDFRIYEAGNQDEARNFLSTVTDEKSFVEETAKKNKDNPDFDAEVSSKMTGVLKIEAINVSRDCADWLFSTTTKVGDMTIFKAQNGPQYYVVMLTKAPHQVNTVSVRHILFATTDVETGAMLSDAEIIQKKRDSEAALKKWQESDKTAESFGDLAAELTDDTGSIPNGGLYENVRPGQMVHEFDEWIFDKNRKPGDTAIIETDYGYHVMYFEKNDGMYYDSTIRESVAEEDINKTLEACVAEKEDTLKMSFDDMATTEKSINEHIEKTLQKQKES